jgi:flagellar motility protein MotE (MotC chaperone)
MKKIAIFLIALAILGLGIIVFAQTTTPRLWERIREKPRISTQEFQRNREEIKKQIEQIRLEFRNQIQEKREEMKARIEALKAQLREKLRERISERKREIVERIYNRINALNERITNHYMDVLDHLEKVLERIESRTAKAKLNGRDVSSVEAAIEKAHQAINTAREAVKAQAEKVYEPPEVTTEANLKLDVGKLRKQLHDDLKAVEKLVKDARDAVREAAVALAQIPKVDELEVPTTTETTTQPTQ